ncbi:hypothetical protein [Zobellia galactanivorans]|uniref:hypothetical protein n=1 Tax=Zobellia galactanivorans (strain DSM 12802 / CCUG 47099 / CIP 106680 / NCIMB 13871 / Dsij) TaxID=63186 RepID=UPI001C07758B|nr:hypothetical protein [Zobellia galactanivorans]MBU3024535.1 hypothetical protein [Zobellia galactanivorans]
MPRRKTLQSVSHNFGRSFTSLVNYVKTDYFLDLLLKKMRQTGQDRLDVDILKNEATPKELITTEIEAAIRSWNNWFPELVKHSGSSMDFVKSAKMTLCFDLNASRPYPKDTRFTETPFACTVTIRDDRGREYQHGHKDFVLC